MMKLPFLFPFLLLLIAILSNAIVVAMTVDEHAQIVAKNWELRKLHAVRTSAAAAQGVDFSTLLSVDTQACLKNSGYVFAIPRGYQSFGQVDPNLVNNVRHAHAAGFPYVDVYFFPCVVNCNGQSATQQLYNLWDVFTNNQLSVGMIWYDAESSSHSGTVAQNQAHLNEFMQAAAHLNVNYGIYSSKYMWSTLYGSSFRVNSLIPIWYAHYDNWASCGDWSSFGFNGVTQPALKQYIGDTSKCGAGIDITVYC